MTKAHMRMPKTPKEKETNAHKLIYNFIFTVKNLSICYKYKSMIIYWFNYEIMYNYFNVWDEYKMISFVVHTKGHTLFHTLGRLNQIA